MKKKIQEGYFYSINPFNSKQVKGYSLLPEDVDLIVFWTKNPKPFFQYLDLIDTKGYEYYFQYTLNDYPKIFEPFMPPLEKKLEESSQFPFNKLFLIIIYTKIKNNK